jgi:putative ABC transport system permease protein
MLQILSALRRHRTSSILIVLEIALTCAIVCNAVFLIRERLARMNQPSGVAEDELMSVRLAGIGAQDKTEATTDRDLAALRALPGVKAATSIDMVPFSDTSWNSNVTTVRDGADGPSCGEYMGRNLIDTLGLHLIAGRDFLPEEYISGDPSDTRYARHIIVTKAMADHFYPDGALGKPLYASGPEPQIIVGVIDTIARPNEGVGGPDARYYAFLLPISLPFTFFNRYVLRADPSQRDAVFAAIAPALNKIDPNRLILAEQTFGEIREDHFKADRSMAWLLAGVSLALLVITALGVVGLASFWVQQRTRQIGVRRALGATRGDILRYFQLENFILATLGIAIGMGMAFGLNVILMHEYEIPRLPGSYLPIGAALLWLLGQIAVLGPALRASLIPPAVATRTV